MAVLEVTLLGDNLDTMMAAAKAVIQFLRPLADEFRIVRKAVPGRLDMHGAFVLRPNGQSLEALNTQLAATWTGVRAFNAFPTVFTDKIEVRPSRHQPLDWLICLLHSTNSKSDWEVVLDGKPAHADAGPGDGSAGPDIPSAAESRCLANQCAHTAAEEQPAQRRRARWI